MLQKENIRSKVERVQSNLHLVSLKYLYALGLSEREETCFVASEAKGEREREACKSCTTCDYCQEWQSDEL